MVVSAFNLSYGIGQLPAGWLADRIGPRFLITIGLVGVALTGLLIGLSQTFVMLLVFLVLMGMFGGGYHPAASPLIAASVEPEKRGRALGFHLIGGSSSFFLAPIIAAAIAAVWGWRGSFIVLAAPTIVFGMIFYVLLSRRKDVGRSESIATNHEILRSIPGQTRHLVAFMILTTSVQAVILSVIAFMPLFMVDQFGVSEGTAAASLAYVYVAGLWASPLGGYLSDRLGRVPVMLVISFIIGPIIYMMNLMPYGPYGIGFGAVLLSIGTIMSIRMPVSEAYIFEQTSMRHRSTVLGIYFFASLEAGGVLTPVAGYCIDQLGFYFTLTIAGVITVIATLICSIFLLERRK